MNQEIEIHETATLNIDTSETVNARDLEAAQRLFTPESEVPSGISNVSPVDRRSSNPKSRRRKHRHYHHFLQTTRHHNPFNPNGSRHHQYQQQRDLSEVAADDELANGGTPPEPIPVQHFVVLELNDSYMKSASGILCFLQVTLSFAGLICLILSGNSEYLGLPMAWRLRVFVGTFTFSLLTSLSLLCANVIGLVTFLRTVNWNLFSCVIFGCLSVAGMVATTLLCAAVIHYYYHEDRKTVSHTSLEQLTSATVFGYLVTIFNFTSAVIGYRKWKGTGQFRRYRFQDSHIDSQLGQIEDTIT